MAGGRAGRRIDAPGWPALLGMDGGTNGSIELRRGKAWLSSARSHRRRRHRALRRSSDEQRGERSSSASAGARTRRPAGQLLAPRCTRPGLVRPLRLRGAPRVGRRADRDVEERRVANAGLDEVHVLLERVGRGVVSEPLLNQLGVLPAAAVFRWREEQRGAGVPEGVDRDPRDPGSPRGPRQDLAEEVVAVEACAG